MTEENRIIYILTMQVRKSKLVTINIKVYRMEHSRHRKNLIWVGSLYC